MGSKRIAVIGGFTLDEVIWGGNIYHSIGGGVYHSIKPFINTPKYTFYVYYKGNRALIEKDLKNIDNIVLRILDDTGIARFRLIYKSMGREYYIL